MATIVGAVATSHIPAIGKAIAQKLQDDPYWKPFFKGFDFVQSWLQQARPDVAVVIYNDHGLNFFLDKMPTFAVGAADEYRNADEGWGLPVAQSFKGDSKLSWHIIEGLVGDEFDVTMCQEMLVDHAVAVPMQLMWPRRDEPVRIVPVEINTVQHPLPSAARSFKFGQAIGRAIESYPENLRVVILGTGGLSHQLDGERAGFINKEFDTLCMEKIAREPEALTGYSTPELVRLAGTQGVEFLNWLAMRGAMLGEVKEAFRNYHIPISNTAAATMVFDHNPVAQRKAA
jgi:protocatechuate 4,5-dioxygenase beta chain